MMKQRHTMMSEAKKMCPPSSIDFQHPRNLYLNIRSSASVCVPRLCQISNICFTVCSFCWVIMAIEFDSFLPIISTMWKVTMARNRRNMLDVIRAFSKHLLWFTFFYLCGRLFHFRFFLLHLEDVITIHELLSVGWRWWWQALFPYQTDQSTQTPLERLKFHGMMALFILIIFLLPCLLPSSDKMTWWKQIRHIHILLIIH